MSSDSDRDAMAGYLDLVRERPELFANHSRGGIAILTTPEDIDEARAEARATREAMGMDATDTRVGLLARDPYMTVVRDAVRFPDGSRGLYNRIIEESPIAVLPLLDGHPVLMRVFRHGLRDWSLEFPRGGVDPGETPEDAARREVTEEIGAETLELVSLGAFTPGGSSLSIRARLFLAHVRGLGAADRREGIEAVRAYPVPEVEALVAAGEIIDGFSMALFLRAQLQGHLTVA